MIMQKERYSNKYSLKKTIRQISNEISEEIYQKLMEIVVDEERRKERERYEKRKHISKKSLDDNEVVVKAITESLEEAFFYQETVKKVKEVILSCTPIQQRRFYMYYVYGYSLKQIALIEKCQVAAISEAIRTVAKKIKNELKK